MVDINATDLDSFDSYYQCVQNSHTDGKTRTKSRVNGFGNNQKNPYWGSTGAPFGRFGPKNYHDKVNAPRRSVTGNDLPGARSIVQNVLLKAEKYPRKSKIPNDMANFAALYITHDIANQVSERLQTKPCEDMRCCFKENKGILPRFSSNSACFPIPVQNDDPFYKDHDVKCLNFVRSQKTSLPTKLQFGEIKNKATGYLDLSLVYGNEETDTKDIRSNSRGQLNMNSKNLLATDSNGNYTKISDRMLAVPSSAVWPALFTRNHNKLAEDLANLYPKWKDEKVFQEAKRINIAVLQNVVFNNADFIFESKGGLKINENYDENVDVTSNLEFHTAAYRYFHFYVNTNVKFIDKTGAVTNIPLSEAFGKLNLIEDKFDDVINGLFSQEFNFGQYSDEIVNKFAKNDEGLGVDVISFDVQRGKFHPLFIILNLMNTLL